jgi:hypothetical protein
MYSTSYLESFDWAKDSLPTKLKYRLQPTPLPDNQFIKTVSTSSGFFSIKEEMTCISLFKTKSAGVQKPIKPVVGS